MNAPSIPAPVALATQQHAGPDATDGMPAIYRTLGREAARGCAARLVTMAGLGIPPGSTDEQFALVITDPSVASVRRTRPDGSVDEMAPVDGVAVLATRTGWAGGGRTEAIDDEGNVLAVC